MHFLLRGNITRTAAGYGLDLTVLDAATEIPLDTRTLSAQGLPPASMMPVQQLNIALGRLTFAALKQEVARARERPDADLDVRDLTFRAYVDARSDSPDRPAIYAAAQRSLDRALALNPDNPFALALTAEINLCECLRAWAPDTGDMERIGEAALERALASRPDYSALLGLRAWLLLKRGRHGDALLVTEQVLARTPDDAEALRQRVIALFKLGDIERAVAALPAMLKADEDRWTQAEAAAVHFAAGDDAAAIRFARQALVQMSQSKRADPINGVVALVLVAAESRAGRLDRARAALKDFHAAVPQARTVAEIKAWRAERSMLPDTPAFWDALRRAGSGA